MAGSHHVHLERAQASVGNQLHQLRQSEAFRFAQRQQQQLSALAVAASSTTAATNSTWHTIVSVITWLWTPIGLMGIVHWLVALRVSKLPKELTDKFEKNRVNWCNLAGLDISSPIFWGFFGTCKLSGLLAIHGVFGPQLDFVANICWIIMMLGALYSHVMLKEPILAPAACLGLMVFRLYALMSE